jgi:outer membrane receptor protein involved in Fe transport
MTALVVLLHALGTPDPVPSNGVRENVVVTAERAPEPRESIPAAVSVFTREEIERLPAEDLGELLRYLPGFHVHFGTPFGGSPMVSTRGFFGGGEAEYVQLLVDGVPVSDVESGLADWRRIRAADVERIEALRGPASALYGDTALGGLIQVFTRRAAVGRDLTVAVSGASFGSAAADARASFSVGSATIGAAASAFRTDGFREHAGADEGGADVSVRIPGSPGSWTVSLSGSSREREEPGPRTREQLADDRFGSDPLFRLDRDRTRRGRASVSFRSGGERSAVRGLIYGALRDAEPTRTLLVAPGVGDRLFRSVETDALGGSMEAERSFGTAGREAHIVAGVDAAREGLDTAYRTVDDAGVRGDEVARVSGHRDRFAVFASGAWEPAARVRLTAGARWDSIADRFGAAGEGSRQAWSPRAGVSVRVGALDARPVSLFVQASRAFKAPTIDQLFDPRPFPDFAGGTFRISNPQLQPQNAETIEAGASRRGEDSSFEIALYRTDVDDEIDFDTTTFRYANIGRTRHRGVEFSARLFERSPVSPFVSWSWTRTEPREGENRGRQLKNIPEHLLRPGVSVALPAAIRLEAAATILEGRFLDDAHAFPLDDAAVVDVRLEKRFARARVRLDVLNVTDEEWEEIGYALPDFAGDLTPYYFPGAGRAVRLGLEWAF